MVVVVAALLAAAHPAQEAVAGTTAHAAALAAPLGGVMTHHQGAAETAAPHLAADPHLLTALRAGVMTAGAAHLGGRALPVHLPQQHAAAAAAAAHPAAHGTAVKAAEQAQHRHCRPFIQPPAEDAGAVQEPNSAPRC